jgi:hypothetical protein
MTYILTVEDLASITDFESFHGTDRLLPPVADIPKAFREYLTNPYARVAADIFRGSETLEYEIHLKEGFDLLAVNRCIQAHLRSWAPKHQHKLAGVGFMISLVANLKKDGVTLEGTA